ncbi:MAG: tetratricopeptide repeat protein, partial [Alphaproteobacteria bacterium]|nr:tetratricopeptide repeat protein [Alphaproteobacteria bacterium]
PNKTSLKAPTSSAQLSPQREITLLAIGSELAARQAPDRLRTIIDGALNRRRLERRYLNSEAKPIRRFLGLSAPTKTSPRPNGRVRVSAQLIDTDTGNHVWAQRYDRDISDIFDLQDEIVMTIAGAIEPEIGLAEQVRAQKMPAGNLDAWDLYQQGMWHMWRYERKGNSRAQELFGEAIALDPDLAAAHANLAHTHFLDAVAAFGGAAEISMEKAIQCARRAVAIDDKEAIAHWALGRANTARGLFKEAIAELRTALALNPSFALAHYALGYALASSGELEAGLPHMREARQLSPFDPQIAIFEAIEGTTRLALDDYAAAEEFGQAAARRPRTTFYSYVTLASALGHLERTGEAQQALSKLMELKPDFSEAWWHRTWAGTSPAFHRRLFDGLYRAGLARPPDRPELV